MKLDPQRLRQRDHVSCGPAVAVVAGALLDPGYRTKLTDVAGRVWFDGEQRRVHLAANRVWPRALGTTPMGIARTISGFGTRYRWRLCRGLWGRADDLADVVAAVDAQRPVAMLIGNVIPRHWVLIVEVEVDVEAGVLHCYEPSSGAVRPVPMADVRAARLTGLGFPRPFAFVLPR